MDRGNLTDPDHVRPSYCHLTHKGPISHQLGPLPKPASQAHIGRMRYFFHIDTGTGLIRDHEGGDYESLTEAAEEGKQSARDIIVEELRQGRPLPLEWLILITPDHGPSITVPFASLAPNPGEKLTFPQAVARTSRQYERVRESNREIRETVDRIREAIRALP
jgi:hypothetical protein